MAFSIPALHQELEPDVLPFVRCVMPSGSESTSKEFDKWTYENKVTLDTPGQENQPPFYNWKKKFGGLVKSLASLS